MFLLNTGLTCLVQLIRKAQDAGKGSRWKNPRVFRKSRKLLYRVARKEGGSVRSISEENDLDVTFLSELLYHML